MHLLDIWCIFIGNGVIQKLSVKQLFSEACSRPLELISGLCIFAAVAAGGAVEDVASTSLAVLFIACFLYIFKWHQLWTQLTSGERLVLFGFGLCACSALLSYYNVSDTHEYVKHFGRYLRYFLIIPIYLMLSRANLKLFNYLLAGAIVSGVVYLSIALISVSERPGEPATGGYHHITFGDMAMLNAMFMTSVLAFMKSHKLLKAVMVVSIICLLYASILSQARGAWLALPFCLCLLLYVAVKYKKIKLQQILIPFILLMVVAGMSPVKDIVTTRIQEAVKEVELFYSGEQYASSVGGRLAMWNVAMNIWENHPVIGTGPGDFDEDLHARQEGGLYKSIDVHSSAHNIYIQALATTGTIGFIILCLALFVLPFRSFYRTNIDGELNIAGLSGLIVITAFAVFGLTASWILRAPIVSVYLTYVVVLLTTASREAVEAEDSKYL